MRSLHSCKTLGGIGASLLASSTLIPIPLGAIALIPPLITTAIPIIGGETQEFILIFLGLISILAALVGGTLFLLAFKGLAQLYAEEGIFRNARYGFISSIASITNIAVIMVALEGVYRSTPPYDIYIGQMFKLMVAVASISFLLASMFYKRALALTSLESGEGRFKVSGALLPVSALLFSVSTLYLIVPTTSSTWFLVYSLFLATALVAEGILLSAWIWVAKAFISVKG